MITSKRIKNYSAALLASGLLAACTPSSTIDKLHGEGILPPQLTPRSASYDDLTNLPQPKGKIVAAVYNVKDQTGQYRAAPASTFSTAVSQGATSMLTQILNESGWFLTLEREGLQNLLTERKIIRAALKKNKAHSNNDQDLPSLLSANILIEGAITAYETNLKTGGSGARYFGIGASELYRSDQVTVHLRAVDIRTGQILNTVSTSKTIFSKQVSADVFRFVEFKRLLEMEAGYSRNEPAQLCLMSAMESAVIHLITQGIEDNHWQLATHEGRDHPVLSRYLQETPEESLNPFVIASQE